MKRLLIPLIGIIFFVLLIVLMRRFDPTQVSWYPVCPFYTLTHLQCPGCGATRTLNALAQARFDDLFRYNIIFFPMLFLAGLLLLFPSLSNHRWILWGTLFIIFIFWITRNIFSF